MINVFKCVKSVCERKYISYYIFEYLFNKEITYLIIGFVDTSGYQLVLVLLFLIKNELN